MSRRHSRPTQFLIALLALIAAIGCSDSSGPGEPAEDPGLLLVPPTDGGYHPRDLVWTRDGSELVYIRGAVVNGFSATVLNAVSVSTHVVRAVYQSPSIVELAPESAGGRIYFGVFLTAAGLNDPNFQVSRVHLTSGAVEVLATTFLGDNDILVSDDERFLVVARGLYDLQAGTRIDLPAGIPTGFSPDGTQLLLVDQTTTSIQSGRLISTVDGSSQPLHSTDYFVLAHRWEGNSPQLLSSAYELGGGGKRLYEVDGLTGARRDLAQFNNSTSGYIYANWSPDGQRLAAWIHEGFGETRTTSLYIIRPGVAPAIVATVHGDPGPPVFSPNGNSVAYFYYHANDTRSLYLKPGI